LFQRAPVLAAVSAIAIIASLARGFAESARDGVDARGDGAQGQRARNPPNTSSCAPGLILFTYLHLAPDRRLARELLRRGVSALGYETVQLEDRSLPLLAR